MLVHLYDVVVIGFALYYLAMLFIHEDGPADIFHKIRVGAGARVEYLVDDGQGGYDWDTEPTEQYENRRYTGTSYLSNILTCHRCFAPYGAVFLLALYFLFPLAVQLIAIMGVSVFVAEYA